MKVAIDRRSSTVADYVESYLGAEERERFLEVVATKVRLMVEIREIQEKVRGQDHYNKVAENIFSGETRRDAAGGGVAIGGDQLCQLLK